jgi:hypothetical protein
MPNGAVLGLDGALNTAGRGWASSIIVDTGLKG